MKGVGLDQHQRVTDPQNWQAEKASLLMDKSFPIVIHTYHYHPGSVQLSIIQDDREVSTVCFAKGFFLLRG
jgi:hypothetical protein